MGDANLIRTLGDYSKPGHESYRNTIELSIRNNVLEEDPKNSNAAERKEEKRGTSQPELKDPTNIEKIGPSRNDKERETEWLDVEEPLDLVDTSHKFMANAYIDIDLPMNIMSLAYYNTIRKNGYEYMGRNLVGLGRDMHVFVGNMSYVMDFTILENIETSTDPRLSYVIFGQPFVEIACLAINRKHSEDDYDKGCRKPSDLEDGFYRDTIKLGPKYLTRMDDEG
ncbi:hypothetical protein Tco_0739303 [Tanacetum coccineum]